MIAQTPGKTWPYVLERQRPLRVTATVQDGSGPATPDITLGYYLTQSGAEKAIERFARDKRYSALAVVPNEDAPPEADRAVFTLRTISNRVRMAIADMGRPADRSSTAEEKFDAMLTALRAGLATWKNVRDEDGAEVPFVTSTKPCTIAGKELIVPSDETLDHLHIDDVVELHAAINEGNRLSRDDRGN